MKRLFLLLAFLLAGCGAVEQRQAVRHAETYIADKKPMAERGELAWSEYYKGLYNFLMWANAPGDTLGRVNEMTRVAQDYEAGKITKDEFDYRRRAVQAETRTADQTRAQQQAQASASQMAVAAQLLQASGPRVIVPQPVAPAPSGAGIVGFFQSQSTSGNLRYCRYSNGVVTTINVVELCPMNTQ